MTATLQSDLVAKLRADLHTVTPLAEVALRPDEQGVTVSFPMAGPFGVGIDPDRSEEPSVSVVSCGNWAQEIIWESWTARGQKKSWPSCPTNDDHPLWLTDHAHGITWDCDECGVSRPLGTIPPQSMSPDWVPPLQLPPMEYRGRVRWWKQTMGVVNIPAENVDIWLWHRQLLGTDHLLPGEYVRVLVERYSTYVAKLLDHYSSPR